MSKREKKTNPQSQESNATGRDGQGRFTEGNHGGPGNHDAVNERAVYGSKVFHGKVIVVIGEPAMAPSRHERGAASRARVDG